jgi:hypothetical protein
MTSPSKRLGSHDEDVLETFTASVRELVVKHGRKQSTLFQLIRDVMSAEAKSLPKVPVLYCKQHGGYGYDESFEAFMADRISDSDSEADSDSDSEAAKHITNGYNGHRVEDYRHIVPYGRFCMEVSHPEVGAMIRIYHEKGIASLFKLVSGISSHRGGIERLRKLLVVIEGIPDDAFGTVDDPDEVYWGLSYVINICVGKDAEKLCRTTRAALSAQVQKHLAEEAAKEAACMEQVPATLDAAVLEDMVASLTHLYPEEIKDRRKSSYDRKDWRDNIPAEDRRTHMTFKESVELHGPTHWAIWKCQSSYFRKDAMRYLLLPGRRELVAASLPSQVYDEEAMFEQAGLLFASGTHCALAVARVPATMEWHIGEYDGLERVSIV